MTATTNPLSVWLPFDSQRVAFICTSTYPHHYRPISQFPFFRRQFHPLRVLLATVADDTLLLQPFAAVLEVLPPRFINATNLSFMVARSATVHKTAKRSSTLTLSVVLYPVDLQHRVVCVLAKDPSVLFMQMQSLGSRYHSHRASAPPTIPRPRSSMNDRIFGSSWDFLLDISRCGGYRMMPA